MNSSNYKMNKTGKRLLFNFLILSFSLLISSNLYSIKSEESKLRISKIARIIKEFTDAQEKLTDPFVQEAIFDKVGRQFKLQPDKKPIVKGVSEIAKEIRETVDRKFPDSSKDIRRKAEKEAKKKFKVKDKLDFVTVKVTRGGHSFNVSGIFYGYGIGGKSVRIGDNTPIAFFDLADKDRAKFDKRFCEEQRQKYVKEKIRSYNNRKQSFLNQEFAERLGSITKANEDMGYIYVWNKWRTPKNVTKYLIEKKIRDQQKNQPDNGDNNNGDNFVVVPKDPIKDPVDPVKDPYDPDTTANVTEDEKGLKLIRLKQEVEKRQMEIAGSQYGIDADQGFEKGDLLVLIGMEQEDVNLLTGTTANSLSYPKGPIETVSFSYINGVLYKIFIKYRIGPPKGMELLLRKIHDKYGDSKEAKIAKKKEEERLAKLSKIKNLCPEDKHKWKKGKCTKCKVKKTDLYPPINTTLVETWKGNIIEAQLIASIASDGSNFTKFELTKENPKIKEEQEKILEEERIRQAEEEKRRELEEYKKQLK